MAIAMADACGRRRSRTVARSRVLPQSATAPDFLTRSPQRGILARRLLQECDQALDVVDGVANPAQ
jgi:hypothetical protein